MNIVNILVLAKLRMPKQSQQYHLYNEINFKQKKYFDKAKYQKELELYKKTDYHNVI